MKALILNAARFPAQIMTNLEQRPALLQDENLHTVITVCKILAREGLRSRVLDVVAGLEHSRKAATLRALRARQEH